LQRLCKVGKHEMWWNMHNVLSGSLSIL